MKTTILLILLGIASSNVYARTINVGNNKFHKSIQAAISKAQSFDTLLVHSGVYNEHTLVIDKPLCIIGVNFPVIDAQNLMNEIFLIVSDNVHIEGLVFRNIATSFLKELSAIKVKHSKKGSIKNNFFESCFFGIYLEYAEDYIIENNSIKGSFDDEAKAGNAIHVWKGNRIKITGNELTGHRDGIYFEFVNNSVISQNKSHNNLRYGLHFMFSNDDQYISNQFIENGAGVAVMFSKNIIMDQNIFLENWGGASYGLLLKEISDGAITNNLFKLNTIGILAEGANRLVVKNNQFTSNGTAIDMKGNCLDNQVIENNFLTNTFEVVTNSNYNQNLYLHNYWSQYSGYDLNRDGIGDQAYRPVNLFSKVSHEIPAATILLHSFLIDMLVVGERLFPEVIPAELIDTQPKMIPYIYDFN